MTRRRRFGAAWGLTVSAVLAACGPAARDDGASAARTYTVRGVVRAAEGELTVQHEAIPDFVGRSGEVEPMHAMTMSFPVGPGVDLATLAPGMPIELDLAVDWDASPPALVTAVRPLPAEAEPEPAPGTGPGATTHDDPPPGTGPGATTHDDPPPGTAPGTTMPERDVAPPPVGGARI